MFEYIAIGTLLVLVSGIAVLQIPHIVIPGAFVLFTFSLMAHHSSPERAAMAWGITGLIVLLANLVSPPSETN